jgi:signal transduction histidine kinase/ActR/RegA family two-component response regulator
MNSIAISPRILVVEDDIAVAKEIESMIRRQGYEVSTVVASEDAAFSAVARSQPDLVLVDMQLRGGMDGIEISKQIQSRLKIPVVYITAQFDHEILQHARLAKPYGYILKPIDFEELSTIIEVTLNAHSAKKKLLESEVEVLKLSQNLDHRLHENVQLYQAEREQRELAETLIEASQILVSTLNVNVVLDRILEQVSRIVKNDVCNIMLIEGDRTDVVRSRGYEDFDAGTFIDTFVFPLSGLSIRHQIIETGEPIVVPDVRMDTRWKLPADAAWLRSYMAAPISIQKQVIGFINVGISMPGFYGSIHAKWLLAFAHQAAIAFQNARLFEESRKAAGHLEVLSRRLLGIQETERSYIARELHDEVGQSLTAAIYSLQAIQRMPETSMFRAKLEECTAILELTLQQVRNMSLDLHPALLDDLGLVPALRWYIDREAQWGDFTAQVIADSMDERLPTEIELVCFRVVQEALTNVTRHARARHVTVELWKRGSELHLVVRDDGLGFNVQEALERAVKGASLGLLGMRERVMLIGGQIEISSAPGNGTEIHTRFPL